VARGFDTGRFWAVRLTERAPAGGQHGHEFVWAGRVVGRLIWRAPSSEGAGGWWLTTPYASDEVVLACRADPADAVAIDAWREEHRPSARWFAQGRVATLVNDARRHRRRP
jgi:hypothetical protein